MPKKNNCECIPSDLVIKKNDCEGKINDLVIKSIFLGGFSALLVLVIAASVAGELIIRSSVIISAMVLVSAMVALVSAAKAKNDAREEIIERGLVLSEAVAEGTVKQIIISCKDHFARRDADGDPVCAAYAEYALDKILETKIIQKIYYDDDDTIVIDMRTLI